MENNEHKFRENGTMDRRKEGRKEAVIYLFALQVRSQIALTRCQRGQHKLSEETLLPYKRQNITTFKLYRNIFERFNVIQALSWWLR